MKVLAIDIGKGTEDVFLWDSNTMSSLENAIQLILPSSASEMSHRLRNIAQKNDKIILHGEIMGGEPWHKTLYELARNGLKVYSTKQAAMSLKYDLSMVRKRGITILSEDEISDYIRENPEATVRTSDVNWNRLERLFDSMNYSFSDIDAVLVCSQDHGFPPNSEISVKAFRTKMHTALLRATRTMSALLFNDHSIPDEFPRLASNLEAIHQRFEKNSLAYVMDSSLAVLSGVFLDPAVSLAKWNLILNFGNGHTIVGMFSPGGKISGILETHTHLVAKNPTRFRLQILDFLNGSLQNDTLLEMGGHGCAYFEDFSPPDNVWVIGPRRSLAKSLDMDYSFAHPIGNMMMSGPLGMLRLAFPDLLELK